MFEKLFIRSIEALVPIVAEVVVEYIVEGIKEGFYINLIFI